MRLIFESLDVAPCRASLTRPLRQVTLQKIQSQTREYAP